MPGPESGLATPARRWLEPPETPLPPESPVAWPVELLHSADAIEVPIVRKQRMFLRLGYAPSHRRLGGVRAVVLAPCLLLIGATVAAAAFAGWRTGASCHDRLVAWEAGDPHRGGTGAIRPSQPAAPVAPMRPTEGATAGAARTSTPGAAISRPRPPAGLEDPSLVLAAVRALRVEHDPQRARALVGDYLQQHPAGSLAEEALAVEIEAAVDHRDPDAALLGAEYLIQYPNGAFAGMAERTVTWHHPR